VGCLVVVVVAAAAAAVVLLLCQRLHDTGRSLFVRNWSKGIGLGLPLLFFVKALSFLYIRQSFISFFRVVDGRTAFVRLE
jgi:uncharacterized membrane protein YhaH (DUF805 family)